ncbi:hypothetical protein CHS0354_011086 [Potamilus streckersoni]|uniref:Lipase domain-containing protein n=1 Tax=Potamilus streckersoni TaxID=2493646 RepID=A0AAE0TL19_9BIVA|nr:hypothetical protein CHS0354_011086 [Potamilus streckersoni]
MDPNVITILLAINCLFSGEAFGNERQTTYENGSNICYGDLGCFIKTSYVLGTYLFPASPDKLDTKFRLFTRQNLNDTMFQMLSAYDVTSIQNSSFDPDKQTKMVVHGYRNNGLSNWMKIMKNELLKAGEFNVILCDWENGAYGQYQQAALNARVVGAEIAKLINVLKNPIRKPPEFSFVKNGPVSQNNRKQKKHLRNCKQVSTKLADVLCYGDIVLPAVFPEMTAENFPRSTIVAHCLKEEISNLPYSNEQDFGKQSRMSLNKQLLEERSHGTQTKSKPDPIVPSTQLPRQHCDIEAMECTQCLCLNHLTKSRKAENPMALAWVMMQGFGSH